MGSLSLSFSRNTQEPVRNICSEHMMSGPQNSHRSHIKTPTHVQRPATVRVPFIVFPIRFVSLDQRPTDQEKEPGWLVIAMNP
ncbi:hypothetical protein M406DRAFT_357751 [Cryphonectria parasitica EP155]|uniref:Uncharacterized protein n=1 Tax=Cryphonectria parasitica (strain ATCC 38755 / EP155) TaxID=660469 RepID=A0A9P5CJY0_CRYP1|nr:uncharacterized protein M406DRAFT_357751 [Cryphonectria parasitica EP155]KAF3761478.1 hypothetical protein M406DRAFT_357751 [Cryphonectria parasitica EP155]